MGYTIDMKELLQILKKRLFLILTITMTFVIVTGLYTYVYLTPKYESSTKLLINQAKTEQSTVNSSEIQANLQLLDTYKQIISSSTILGKVVEKLNIDITVEQLNEQITIENSESSQVLTIIVKDTSAKRATEIANTIAEVFRTEIVKIMKVDNVSILDSATVNDSPVEPNPTINIAIAILIGLGAGMGLAIWLNYFDNTLKSEQDIERELGVPVLGNISIIDQMNIDLLKDRRERKPIVKGGSHGS